MAGARATSRGLGARRRARGAGARPATRRREGGGGGGRGGRSVCACSSLGLFGLVSLEFLGLFWSFRCGVLRAPNSKVHDVQPGPPCSVSCTKFCDGFVRTGSTIAKRSNFLEESLSCTTQWREIPVAGARAICLSTRECLVITGKVLGQFYPSGSYIIFESVWQSFGSSKNNSSFDSSDVAVSLLKLELF